jgi:cytidyltransferase-like protein|eukprot:scaffold433_cov260-Chaetoceros_neogracile.AAC.22
MKFNKTLNASILKEWRFYSVDYKAMKKALKNDGTNSSNTNVTTSSKKEFLHHYELSKSKLTKFYSDKDTWATAYYETMEDRVDILRSTKVSSYSTVELDTVLATDSEDSASSIASNTDSDNEIEVTFVDLSNSIGSRMILDPTTSTLQSDPIVDSNELLKQEYRRIGKSKHFHNYIYAKKSLDTFARELDLILEFLDLNKMAFGKILKKFDKRTGSSIRDEKLKELEISHAFLNGEKVQEMRLKVSKLLSMVSRLKPSLPEGWESRKVYTIGCFDLFHRGHQNALISLREFGYFIVAGIHDDASYYELKKKHTIENLETRMKNVKPFVDQIYVIPSTDPELYLKSVVSEQDIETGSCCYARGDDMLNFPGRGWVESVMPVHFIPRTEACSSTLIRTIYHADDPEIRKKAAFADTRYDGKPVDENGNVLKF